MFQRILVATDGSPLSKKAVKSAVALAAQNGAVAFSPEDIARIEKQWADSSKAMLDAIGQACRERPGGELLRGRKREGHRPAQGLFRGTGRDRLFGRRAPRPRSRRDPSGLQERGLGTHRARHARPRHLRPRADGLGRDQGDRRGRHQRAAGAVAARLPGRSISRTGSCAAPGAAPSAPCPSHCAAARRRRSTAWGS
ncbi:MAG: hypothetical protein EOO26_10740 [Comamonadaceae bacterium]|nr:MAG: hypothetical protein EOO26_10740 [Comamonadaceae bacterium]